MKVQAKHGKVTQNMHGARRNYRYVCGVSANNAKQDNLQAYGIKTRGGTHTQDPLYPEGHPKRIEQDSQVQEEEIVSSPKKKNKKKDKEADNSNDPIADEEPAIDPNNISTCDAETEDGAEPEKDADKNDPP